MSPEQRRRESDADDGVLRRAVRAVGYAANTGYSLGMRIPGVREARKGVRQLERFALTTLRKRLETVDDPYLAALSEASATNRHSGDGRAHTDLVRIDARDEVIESTSIDASAEPLRAAMAELLHRSVGFGTQRAQEYLYAVILRQLTPDEARIISILADGAAFPSLDVVERTALGADRAVLLRNASTVGKAAGVALVDHIPAYVSRLVGLGLVDVTAERAEMDGQYEILQTDTTVRAAVGSAKRTRFIRRTVRISPLGERFWAACAPWDH